MQEACTSVTPWWSVVAGLTGTAAFAMAIWDRTVRYRPLAWIVAVNKTFGQAHSYLRIKNVGPTHILITDVSCNSDVFTVAASDSVGAFMRANAGMPLLAFLAPDGEVDLPLSQGKA